jgi:hypothetical protein
MYGPLNMGNYRIQNIAAGSQLTDLIQVQQLPSQGFPMIISSGSNPTTSAQFIGQIWVNTGTNKVYIATVVGTGATDWQVIN